MRPRGIRLRQRVLAAVLAVLSTTILSGCVDEAWWTNSLSWEQPGLYAGLPADGRSGSYEFSAESPSSFLPFRSETADAAWGVNGYRLVRVSWTDASQPSIVPNPGFRLRDDFHIEATVEETVNASDLHGQFTRFASNVTQASPVQVDVWAQDFLANSYLGGYARSRNGTGFVNFHTHTTQLSGPLRLEELLGDLRRQYGLNQTEELGQAQLTSGEWRFDFEFPIKIASAANGEERWGLVADPGGRIEFSRSGPDDPTDAHLASRLRAAFSELGLSAPTPPEWKFSHLRTHADG